MVLLSSRVWKATSKGVPGLTSDLANSSMPIIVKRHRWSASNRITLRTERQRQRDRETEGQRQRDRGTEPERQRDRGTEGQRDRDRETETETERQGDRQTEGQNSQKAQIKMDPAKTKC